MPEKLVDLGVQVIRFELVTVLIIIVICCLSVIIVLLHI